MSIFPVGKMPSSVFRLPDLLTNSDLEFVIFPWMVTAWPRISCVPKSSRMNSLVCIIKLNTVASNQGETAIIGRNIGYDFVR